MNLNDYYFFIKKTSLAFSYSFLGVQPTKYFTNKIQKNILKKNHFPTKKISISELF